MPPILLAGAAVQIAYASVINGVLSRRKNSNNNNNINRRSNQITAFRHAKWILDNPIYTLCVDNNTNR